MYFVEDVIKYSPIDELKFMLKYYLNAKENYPEFPSLWENQLNESQYLLTVIENYMFTFNDMITIKKYVTIAREIRCGMLNTNKIVAGVINN